MSLSKFGQLRSKVDFIQGRSELLESYLMNCLIALATPIAHSLQKQVNDLNRYFDSQLQWLGLLSLCGPLSILKLDASDPPSFHQAKFA